MKVYHHEQSDAEKARSKKGKKSGVKGKKWEQQVARDLRKILPPHYTVYRRAQNERHHKKNDVEVRNNGVREIGIECKHRDKVNWAESLDQDLVDCSPGALPVAVCKDTGCQAVAIMFYDDWLQLIAESKGER